MRLLRVLVLGESELDLHVVYTSKREPNRVSDAKKRTNERERERREGELTVVSRGLPLLSGRGLSLGRSGGGTSGCRKGD